MNPKITVGPIVEPVSLLETKQQLRVDHVDDDAYISQLIASARGVVEEYLAAALIKQTFSWKLNRFPGTWGAGPWWSEPGSCGSINNRTQRFVRVPRGPLLSVTSITVFDEVDVGLVWAAQNYYVSTSEDRIYRREATAWPRPGRVAEGIEVIYDTGFGATAQDVPVALRQGILDLVSYFYVNRTPSGEMGTGVLPASVRSILDPFRRRRLG